VALSDLDHRACGLAGGEQDQPAVARRSGEMARQTGRGMRCRHGLGEQILQQHARTGGAVHGPTSNCPVRISAENITDAPIATAPSTSAIIAGATRFSSVAIAAVIMGFPAT